MRIVFTIAGLTPESGGPSRSVPALCEALADTGMGIELLTLDYGARYGVPLLPNAAKVRTHRVRCWGSRRIPTWWAIRFARKLRHCVEKGDQAILHDTGAWLPTNHAAARVARQTRTPLVISPRGMMHAWARSYRSGRKALAWRLYAAHDYRSATLFHVTSRDESEDLRSLGLTQPVAVIPNGVELPALVPMPPPTDQPRTALFLSRLHPKKGLEHLLEAWAQLKPAGWRLAVAGDGESVHKQHLRTVSAARGLADAVQFLGPVDGPDKWRLYQSAELFVLPTLSENFGIVVAEALACETPVITTKAAPWSELASHRCGWWIDSGVESLVAALKAALQLTDAERADMGRRGRQLIERQYAWTKVGRQMAEAYRWLLGQGGQPECVIE